MAIVVVVITTPAARVYVLNRSMVQGKSTQTVLSQRLLPSTQPCITSWARSVAASCTA